MKFVPGQIFEHDGVQYRINRGNRCEGDMTIDFRVTRPGFHRPKMAHTLILASFKAQVEENNYGQKDGKIVRGQGMWKWLEAIRTACIYGWEEVSGEIAAERQRAEEKRNGQEARLL